MLIDDLATIRSMYLKVRVRAGMLDGARSPVLLEFADTRAATCWHTSGSAASSGVCDNGYARSRRPYLCRSFLRKRHPLLAGSWRSVPCHRCACVTVVALPSRSHSRLEATGVVPYTSAHQNKRGNCL